MFEVLPYDFDDILIVYIVVIFASVFIYKLTHILVNLFRK